MNVSELLAALDAEINGLSRVGAQCELFATSPKPLFLIGWKGDWRDRDFDTSIMFLVCAIEELDASKRMSAIVRCVEIERLPVILVQGCDVQPANSVLWIDKFPSKALEYGGDEKVMMIFDMNRTEPSYQEVPSDTDQTTLDELRRDYPTVERSTDGSRLWLSRLPAHDTRITMPYEIEHARWIPGAPFDALSGILVLGRDIAKLRRTIAEHIANCEKPDWR
jgi:hypothetical protein